MQITAMAANMGATAPQPRLVGAAHEFEAQMMKELLRPMTGMSNLFGEDEQDSAAGSGNALSEYSAEALAGALSQQGGFGIADCVVRKLSQDGNYSENGKVTKKEHGNTVIRTSK